ncbi:mevalonate kinase (plasmid) [Streptomyces globisporus]|uniref:mevalonate kinase n=1 Tax=Streptomyces globisporus TaxID=1908 RepID=UPI002F91AD4C|nr:mevalonate kinase [Streptomyces globisporus]
MTQGQRFADGAAHGKVILLGEHAAIYGAPALAFPIPALTCRVTVRQSAASGDPASRLYRVSPGPQGAAKEAVSNVPAEFLLLLAAFAEQAGLDAPPAMDIRLDSRVPPSRGLGSSAANARALARALDAFFAVGMDEPSTYDLVQVSERSAHGMASGIDALATGSEHPVLLTHARPRTPLVGADLHLVVIDSGSGAGTRRAVEMLRDTFAQHPEERTRFVHRSTALTEAALADMAAGCLSPLGQHLNDCHAMLAALGLTTNRTDALVHMALDAGALGAKMTGGGLGGCVVALTRTAAQAASVASTLTDRAGVQTWITTTRRAQHDRP